MEKDRKTLSDMQDSSGSFDILEWRRTAQSFGHGTLQGLGTGRPHPKVRAAALLRQAEHAPTDLVTDLQTSLGKYGQAVLQFEQCMGRIGSTMAKEAREQTKTLLLGAGSAEDALKELATAVEAFGAVEGHPEAVQGEETTQVQRENGTGDQAPPLPGHSAVIGQAHGQCGVDPVPRWATRGQLAGICAHFVGHLRRR